MIKFYTLLGLTFAVLVGGTAPAKAMNLLVAVGAPDTAVLTQELALRRAAEVSRVEPAAGESKDHEQANEEQTQK